MFQITRVRAGTGQGKNKGRRRGSAGQGWQARQVQSTMTGHWRQARRVSQGRCRHFTASKAGAGLVRPGQGQGKPRAQKPLHLQHCRACRKYIQAGSRPFLQGQATRIRNSGLPTAVDTRRSSGNDSGTSRTGTARHDTGRIIVLPRPQAYPCQSFPST
jgi:hypothetical protein